MADTVITVTDLVRVVGDRRHRHTAVDGISLTVDRGEVVGILGPNGAGKTTTVECIAGLQPRDGGSVTVLGTDPAEDPEAVRRRVGVQLQHAVLPQRMRVGEAVRLFATAHGRPDAGAALLEEWGLAGRERAPFGGLSGGQRQRLFIVLALLGDPEVVVLDEITTGLDPAARRDTWALVEGLRARGTTVLTVTHAMDEAEHLCDRLYVIVDGRVVATGTPEAIRGDHRSLEDAYLELTRPTGSRSTASRPTARRPTASRPTTAGGR